MSIWTRENIKKKTEILKNVLEPLISKNEIKLEISCDSKIYIQVKHEVKDKFIEDFSPLIKIYNDTICENDDDKWFEFDYLELYDAIICEEIYLIALAYAIQDFDLGDVPDIIEMGLEEKIEEEEECN